MRVRLRPVHADTAAFYSERYPGGYHHDRWPDHVERVAATVDFARGLLTDGLVNSVADLSCGDGAVARGIVETPGARIHRVVLGDVNIPKELIVSSLDRNGSWPESIVFWEGTLDQTMASLEDRPVDLFVSSETLEHLDDPDAYLRAAREKSRYLLLTTPDGEQPSADGGGNVEHYWGWDAEAVSSMLHEAGWRVTDHRIFTPVSADVYRFQMWTAY